MGINWYTAAAMLFLFSIGAFLKLLLSDDTEPWTNDHYLWYVVLIFLVTVCMCAIIYLGWRLS